MNSTYSNKLLITDYRLPITDYRLPITDYPCPTSPFHRLNQTLKELHCSLNIPDIFHT